MNGNYENPRRCEIWLMANGRDNKNSRLCIIVSNNTGNTYSPVVEVVYAVPQKEAELPTHFVLESVSKPYIALCERVTTIRKEDLVKYYGRLNAKEIVKLNKCLKISLGLSEERAKKSFRNEIWLAVDHNARKKSSGQYNGSVQGGTRFCIVVSDASRNARSPFVEVVYTTTQTKADLPTHFMVTSTPKLSTALCEQVMTVQKKDLMRYHGRISDDEAGQLDKCLKISLGL